MDINLNLKKSAFVPKMFPYLLDYSHRWEIHRGSAGSAKSYFITQKLIIRAINERIRILVCRRYGTTIRQTCFALFKEILEKWQLTPYVKIRETDFNITFSNGSEIIFTGLDEEGKLLSLTNIGTIFIEEATEVPRDMVEQLNLRMRGKNKQQQIIMAFNPCSKNHWLRDFCEVNPPENLLYIKSSFRDNPFLPEEYVKSLEELLERNPRKAQVYVLNEWGSDDDGLVFTNWREEEFDVLKLASTPGIEHRAGMDLGFVDPSAIVDTLYDRKNNTIYVINEFYKSGQTLDQLAAAIQQMNLAKTKIQVDAAEPRSIDFFRRKGLNVYPCIKGQNSVKARISFLQNNTIIVLPKCQNVIAELSNFSYIKDKKTGEFTEDTTHEWSHAIDGLGYAYSDIYTNKQLRSFDKKLLSIR